MKIKFLLCFLFASTFAHAQESYRISNYYLVVKGTSNLHDWESPAKEVRVNAAISINAGVLQSIQSLNLEIPVKTIKSSKGSIMDNKTYDALLADKYPNINFKLEKVTGMNLRGGSYDINTVGNLTIAGATNRVEMYVQGKIGSDGSITFTGSKKIKMTDYKIKPPTALMGTLTTGDDVEIAFQITLKKQ